MRTEASELARACREGEQDCCSTTTSSIGNDSDADAESAENEAHSACNGPLYVMDSLQEVLPIRRGISRFYNGKSKSFTSLGDASCSASVKDIAKAENAYGRRRRILMAPRGGISKRTTSSSRSALPLALAFTMNYDSSSTCEDSTSRSPPPPPIRLWTPRGPSSACRSFSLAELQHCAAAATTIKIDHTQLN